LDCELLIGNLLSRPTIAPPQRRSPRRRRPEPVCDHLAVGGVFGVLGVGVARAGIMALSQALLTSDHVRCHV